MINLLENKLKKIKIVISDVDGVLTDGGMYYSENGDIMKKFHVRDGMGVNILLRNGISTVIITKENNVIVKKWCEKMNVKKIYFGVLKKEKMLNNICKHFSVVNEEIAYIGDDVNDMKMMKMVGFSATPKDSVKIVQNNVDYICKKDGGMGAFREISDLILTTKFRNKIIWY